MQLLNTFQFTLFYLKKSFGILVVFVLKMFPVSYYLFQLSKWNVKEKLVLKMAAGPIAERNQGII